MSLPVKVSVPLPTDRTYHYTVPDSFMRTVEIGKRVLVPLRNRLTMGFVVGFGDPPEGIELKQVIDVIDDKPLFDENRLKFFTWISGYYLSSLGTVLKAAYPGGMGISLNRRLKVTSKGLNSLEQGSGGKKQGKILNVVHISESITPKKLFELVDGVKFADLNRLVNKGLLEYNYRLKKLKPRYSKFVSPNERTAKALEELKKKMPAKASVLEFVKTHGRMEADELKVISSGITSHIKWLEERGFIDVETKEVIRDPFRGMEHTPEALPDLTIEQKTALASIDKATGEGVHSTFLLHGVTGSGKTEVYMRAIDSVLKKGKEAIVLVPEISLTPQLVKRFRSRFGDKVAVIHSLLNDAERSDAWKAAINGDVKIIIGARSAVFAPFKHLGIIVVDEEHENTYKQEDRLCYNARDVAVVLGRDMGSVVILGSATPSVESYSNCQRRKFEYLTLPLRMGCGSLPEVEVVDMRKQSGPVFSSILKREIAENFERKDQTVLFLNRRGFSTFLIYEDSGEIFYCPNCSIPFTFHRADNKIKCHYCGTSEDFGFMQKTAKSPLRGLGIGTQMIEHELKNLLPDARIERMDSDSTGGKNKFLELYKRLERKEIDVLIGTQMVAKGHDLPGVTLVGVISADTSLSIPDFRSGERTFQLITQVAGRAGRGRSQGRVIVQTYNPDHPSIRFARSHDSNAFLQKEMDIRQAADYPPFCRLVGFRFSGTDENVLIETVKKIDKIVKTAISGLTPGAVVMLGPSQCPVYKIKNRFRWQMILKAKQIKLLHAFSKNLYDDLLVHKNRIRITMDVDPVNFS